MVGHLAQKARDAGSSPAQHYTFRLYEKFTPEKIIYLIDIYVNPSMLRGADGSFQPVPIMTIVFFIVTALTCQVGL